MINFMVLGGPRCATTWVSNLLTTDNTLCLHDPLMEYTVAQLNQLSVPGKKLGVSCTGLPMFPDWVAAQRCPKILLWREPVEINKSLDALGLQRLDPAKFAMRMGMYDVPVFHWAEVFKADVAKKICKMFDVPYCPYRYNQLVQMNIQPQWQRLQIDKSAVKELLARIQELGVQS